MTLRTLQIDDPPAGVDWLTIVPGQYLYNITGLAGTLTTGAGADGIMYDSSPFHLNGSYINGPIDVAGLVAGNAAKQTTAVAHEHMEVDAPIVDWSGDWSVVFVAEPDLVPQQTITIVARVGTGVTTSQSWRINIDSTLALINIEAIGPGGSNTWVTANGSFPIDGTGHDCVITYAAGSNTITIYVDGSAVVTTPGGPNIPGTAAIDTVFIQRNPATSQGFKGIIDEVSFHPTVLSSSAAAFIHAGKLAGIGPYQTVILAQQPNAYFHMDDGGAGTGRQVALQVTDGMSEVELIPSGFADVVTSGPYDYSWQPNLQASAQTPDGKVTTIAIPRLIVPAGYTIGTDTLDIAAADQWSNIVLWWSDDVMDSVNPISPYAYPPGATLVPRYVRSQP